MFKSLKRVAKDNRGQSMIEYALILALVAVVVIAAVTALGGQVTSVVQSITDALPS